MGARPHRSTDSRYDETPPANSGTVTTGRRTARKTPGRGKAAITDIRIARIETVTMTATEYSDAVEALAVLVARYERNHPDTQPGDQPDNTAA